MTPISDITRLESIQVCEGISYLPSKTEGVSKKLDFLVRFFEEIALVPFTQEQAKIFLSARKWTTINRWSLKIGLGACTVLALAPAILGLPSIQNWETSNNNNAAMMFIVVTLYSGVLGMINYICTGTLPDLAAMASIEVTKKLVEVKTSFEEISCHLIDLYFLDQSLAREKANKINVVSIKAVMKEYVGEEIAHEMCVSLADAASAVLYDRILLDMSPSIRTCWEINKLKQKIDLLTEALSSRAAS